MSYSREVLYLQTKNEGAGVGYIKRDQKGNKRRERIVFTGFPQTGEGEYKGEIAYEGEASVRFEAKLSEGRGEVPIDCEGVADTLPQISRIVVGGIVVYETGESEHVVVDDDIKADDTAACEKEEEEILATEPEEKTENKREEETMTVRDKEPGKAIKKHTIIGNKWDHICSIYPRREPFGDGKQFIKVGLSDFVILNEECYALAQNSFLLHGYYNYGYLVLYRSGEGQYYIGTPGTFYEKEKEVAILYDFTHFECKDDDAKEGTFGYYMIPVKI